MEEFLLLFSISSVASGNIVQNNCIGNLFNHRRLCCGELAILTYGNLHIRILELKNFKPRKCVLELNGTLSHSTEKSKFLSPRVTTFYHVPYLINFVMATKYCFVGNILSLMRSTVRQFQDFIGSCFDCSGKVT